LRQRDHTWYLLAQEKLAFWLKIHIFPNPMFWRNSPQPQRVWRKRLRQGKIVEKDRKATRKSYLATPFLGPIFPLLGEKTSTRVEAQNKAGSPSVRVFAAFWSSPRN